MRRERHKFFLCWLFHLTPPPRLVGHRRAPKIDFLPLDLNLNSNSLNQRAAPVVAKVVWPRPGLNLNYCFFFSNPPNPQRFRVWRHSRLRSHFLCGVFIVSYLIVTSTLRSREHLHSTNPCTKWKVLSLIKLKGKIYKTKNDNIKKKSLRNYITCVPKNKRTHMVRQDFFVYAWLYWFIKWIIKRFTLPRLLEL